MTVTRQCSNVSGRVISQMHHSERGHAQTVTSSCFSCCNLVGPAPCAAGLTTSAVLGAPLGVPLGDDGVPPARGLDGATLAPPPPLPRRTAVGVLPLFPCVPVDLCCLCCHSQAAETTRMPRRATGRLYLRRKSAVCVSAVAQRGDQPSCLQRERTRRSTRRRGPRSGSCR